MSIPFIRDVNLKHGKADELSRLVTRVVCNNPGPFTFTGSGTYLVGSETLAVIDPGPENIDHLEAILDAANGRVISHILITHTHIDHCGGTADLQRETGAVVAGFGRHPGTQGDTPALDEGGDYRFRPDLKLRDGDVITLPYATLTALHTPGHISNHLCFALKEEKALFTGDHVMGWATTVVIPPDGSMSDYMNSLDLLLAREDKIYYPTHGAPINNPQNFVAAIKAHRLEREAQILACLKQGPHTIKQMVEVIYADTPKTLHGAAGLNVFAHLEPFVENGKVKIEDGIYRLV